MRPLRTFGIMSVPILILLGQASGRVEASCTSAKSFATVPAGPPYLYTYLLMGGTTDLSPSSIVGRFWQSDAPAASQGTYPDEAWMFPWTPHAPDAFWISGILSDPRVAGCPARDLTVLAEGVSDGGEEAVFVAARVTEQVAPIEFDLTRIGGDLPARPYPRITVLAVRRAGSAIQLDLSMDDVGSGVLGLPGMTPGQTLTAYRLYKHLSFQGPPPGRNTSEWVLERVLPYSGGPVTLLDYDTECPAFGVSRFAVGLEFAGGAVAGSYVGQAFSLACGFGCEVDCDLDGLCDDVDPCVCDPGNDLDGDGHCAASDNCPARHNPEQSDLDGDGQGDRCDLDDGLIYVHMDAPGWREWQAESGVPVFNSYRGSLAVLKEGGGYTQEPGSDPAADRACGLTEPRAPDPAIPEGEAAFFLTTGVVGGVEGSLGQDSAGFERPNEHPCP